MQSVTRAFKRHLAITVERSQDTNNIIIGQAARHVIAHSGAVIDEKMMRQVATVEPRTLKPIIQVGTQISFSPDEVRLLARSMETYLAALMATLETAIMKWQESRGV